MNGHPKKLVEELQAAKATLRALEDALARTQAMIEQTRKLIDEAKAIQLPNEQAPPTDENT